MEIESQNLKDLEKDFEFCFFVYPIDGICRLAPTGEAFITYTSSGIKSEGEETKAFPTAEEAIESYMNILSTLSVKHTGKDLYWRQRPKLRFYPYTYAADFYGCHYCKELRDEFQAGIVKKKPECKYCFDGKVFTPAYWQIYSRFLISDKPLNNDVLVKYYT